jgi:hypothetical protein
MLYRLMDCQGYTIRFGSPVAFLTIKPWLVIRQNPSRGNSCSDHVPS